ncbi:M23 family metallopeptidase, partial [Candidatus Azambacteria bacterium]|nr:M23 family metallopeptidase [Candidatus Azambacteria bacterium]
MKTIRLVKLLLILSVLIFSSNITLAYQWPLKPFNQQPRIIGTLGEYRSSNGGHLHAGVDMNLATGGPVGTEVFAVEGGIIVFIDTKEKLLDNDPEKNNSYVEIKTSDNRKFRYYHIKPNSDLKINALISTSQLLGEIKTLSKMGPHLHLQEERLGADGKYYVVNPLASLDYFDNAPTEVFPDSLIIKNLKNERVITPEINSQ